MADDVNYPWSAITTTYTMTSGVPVYFQIKASADRFYEVVRFFRSTVSPAMTSFHVSVFKPTTANGLAKIMHCGNVKALLSTAQNLQTILLPEPLDAVAGEVFFVGLLSVGGTPAVLYRALSLVNTDLTIGDYPEYNQITALSTATGKTSFADTETISAVSATNEVTRIWGALGNLVTAPVRPPAFHLDSLNRNNADDLGPLWGGASDIPGFGTYNQMASPQPDASAGAYRYFVRACRSDDHYALVRLGADMATDLDKDIDLYVGVRSTRGVSGGATKLHINSSDGTFRIVNVTRTYDNNGLTERAVADDPIDFVGGDTIKIVANGTAYTALHNDKPKCTWVDSGVIHPVDDDHRWVDIATGQTIVPNLQVVDNFEAGDAIGGVAGGAQAIMLTRVESTATVSAPNVQGPQPPEINIPHTNEPVPEGVSGVYVTLRGAGGGGGGGRSSSDSAVSRYGGGGGGGGAYIERSWIPASELDSTFSVVVGIGGLGGLANGAGVTGGRAEFSSGTLVWKAYGGEGGKVGTTAAAIYASGGTVSITGYAPDGATVSGGRGQGYGSAPSAGAASAGGGSGGYLGIGNIVHDGFDGGDTDTATGGGGTYREGYPGGDSSDHEVGGGAGGGGSASRTGNNYAGGAGGDYGGGGGGTGACASGASQRAGTGGHAYTCIEWVY